MIKSWHTFAIVLSLLSFARISAADPEDEPTAPTWLQNWELTGFAEFESRLFQQSPEHAGQHPAAGISFAGELEFYREWAGGDYQFMGTPFYRFDLRDSERSHFDLREFYVQRLADRWEAKVGVSKVFWGVTETVHLVDVVNQTDLVENLDTEDKLGQPMVNFNYLSDHGTFGLFYLPYFRERTFAGRDGRFRFRLPVETDLATYQSSMEQWHPDIALRWSHVLGEFDIGLHYFYGTSRDPLFQPLAGGTRLAPVYNLMHQTGLDAQWTHEAWLLKFEGLHRSGRGQQFQAVATGFEYTFYQLFGSNLDLGTLSEYHYDARGDAALTPFNHDLFFGGRLTFNDEHDTAILAGAFWDYRNDSSALRIEFERRIGQNYTVELELQKFIKTDPRDFFSAFRRDSFLELSIRRFF